MRAVGFVTHTGAYFFFASAVPRFGSSAIATFATEHAAAATTAIIKSLLVLLLSSLLFATAIFSDSLEALTTTMPRRLLAGTCFATFAAVAPPMNEAVMVMDAIATLFLTVYVVL